MKRTDLEKLKALKLDDQLKRTPAPGRFAAGGELLDRRSQRDADRAAGLVPFAVKLPSSLVEQLHALAQETEHDLPALVAQVLRDGLAHRSDPDDAP